MPKLQAGCTLTAQDGMVVKTARTSEQGGGGAERDARVHPRQPPARLPRLRQGRRVPAAGPDVPLRARQHADELREADLREADPDLAHDLARPRALHPLLPLHALQRGRRARTASSSRANRGAMSVITTFEDLPYTGAFTGNVTELCPVGALLPTQYRFEGRPWEIVDVPTVCGHLPRRLQQSTRPCARGRSSGSSPATTRRSTRAGSATRAASRSRTCAPTTARRADPAHPPARLSSRSRGSEALDEAERLLRAARGRVVIALSGSETVEQAYALGEAAARRASTRTRRCCRRRSPARSTPTGCRSPRSATPRWSSCSATCRSSRARRSSTSGCESARRNGAPDRRRRERPCRRRARSASSSIWSGPGGRGGATRREARGEARARRPGGLRRLLPSRDAERPRRRRRLGRVLRRGGARRPDSIGLLVVSGDEAAGGPERPRARRAAPRRRSSSRCSAGSPPAGPTSSCRARATSSATARTSTSRAACSGCAARRRRPCPDELEWISQLAARFDVDVAPYAAGVFAEVSERVYGGLSFGEVGERAPLRGYPDAPEHVDAPPVPEPQQRRRAARPAARRVQAALLRPRRRARHGAPVPAAAARGRALGRATHAAQGSRPATSSPSARTAASIDAARPARQRRLRAGVARVARRARAGPRAASSTSTPSPRNEVERVTRALVDRAHRGGDRRQHPARPLRVPDADRAQGDGTDAAALRPEPRRPVRPPAADRRPREAHPQGGVLAVVARSSSRTSSRRSSRRSPRSPPSRSSRSARAGR